MVVRLKAPIAGTNQFSLEYSARDEGKGVDDRHRGTEQSALATTTRRAAVRLRGLLLLALAMGLTLPTAALAKPGYRVRPAGTELFVELEKGGYEFSLEANDRQRVLLAVEEGLFSTAEYSTEGHVSSKRVEADLGDLGRVDIKVQLAPGQSQRYPPGKKCHGRASIFVPGTFRGTIEYSGEGGLPALSATRGEVGFIRRFKRVCKLREPATGHGHKKKRKPKLELGYLRVAGKGEGRPVILEAIDFISKQHPARSFGLLFAGAYERREEVRIERTRLEFFGGQSLEMSKRGKQPQTVRVKPPQPFAGRGIYLRRPGSPPSWTGDLRVDLLGAADTPLVRPESTAVFCRGFLLVKVESCVFGADFQFRSLARRRPSSPLIAALAAGTHGGLKETRR